MSPGKDNQTPPGQSSKYRLLVVQQPKTGKVAVNGKEKDRKPFDPPPIVQLFNLDFDPTWKWLACPFLVMTCRLLYPSDTRETKEAPRDSSIVGTICSSLHSLKDSNNVQSAYFIFTDVSSKLEGNFVLQFNLWNMQDQQCRLMAQTESDVFTVSNSKLYPGLCESTSITRSFSEQGVRLRLRKDSRNQTTKKRNQALANIGGHLNPRHSDRPPGSMGGMGTMTAMASYSFPAGNEYGDRDSKRQRPDGGTEETNHFMHPDCTAQQPSSQWDDGHSPKSQQDPEYVMSMAIGETASRQVLSANGDYHHIPSMGSPMPGFAVPRIEPPDFPSTSVASGPNSAASHVWSLPGQDEFPVLSDF